MTVSSETTRNDYTGNGVTTEFAYSFRIWSDTDLLVVTADGDGVETTLELTTDYTVTGAGLTTGGSITLLEPLASGHKLAILSAIPALQGQKLSTQSGFRAEVQEASLDKLTRIAQQNSEKLSRALVLPVTTSEDGADLAVSFVQATADAEEAAAQASLSAEASANSAAGALHGYDVRWYGGISGGTSAANATAFSATVTAALAGGVKRVYVPFDSWTVTTGTDAQGCIVCGNGKTALTGVMGAARYDGCIIDGSAQDYRTIHPHIPLDTTPKLVKVHDANTIRIVVEKPTTGYSYLTLKNNSTTAGTDSLATTTSDATMWRMTALQDAVECLVGVLTASSSNGTWAGVGLTTDVPTHTSGTSYSYQRSTTIGAWYEWTVTVPLDGELIVGFLEASGASSDVTITVDGVAIDSNFTTVSATPRRRLRKYSVVPGSHTVRVTNNTAGSTGLNLLGLYFARLKDARNDIAYDAYGIYRNSAYLDPVIQSSANDLVLKDYNSTINGAPGIYGGSYHGGESSISSTLLIDGASQAIAAGNLYVGKSVELHQSCTITWSGAKSGCTYSGDSVDVRSRTIILRGGLANCPTVTGEFTARELYTTLVGVNEDFTALTSPVYKTLSSITDGATYALGQHNSVEYSYNNQRLRITHSSLEAPDSAKGGSYVWRVVGSYVKYYSPWVWRGKRDISSISSVTIIQAS